MAIKTKDTITHVDPATLVRNKQVRRDRNEGADKELAASIKRSGVLMPVRVRMVSGKLHVIDGHRRTEAAIAAGVKSIPVYVSDTPDAEITLQQLVMNIQRDDLSLADTSRAVRELHEGPGGGLASYTAERLGKSAGWVSKMLLVAGGEGVKPGEIARKLVQTDKIGDLESAYLLCKLEEKNPAAAKAVADNIANETRASIKRALQNAKKAKPEAADGGEEEQDATPMWKWLAKVAKSATVSARDLPLQEQAIAMIAEQLAE
jgi:ParB family chromosome partitioning protein